MKRFDVCESWFQAPLFAESLDDFIFEGNSVRTIEAFVNATELGMVKRFIGRISVVHDSSEDLE